MRNCSVETRSAAFRPDHYPQLVEGLRAIPTGLCPPAQGCEARATLGQPQKIKPTPTGLRRGLARPPSKPPGGGGNPAKNTPTRAGPSTLGFWAGNPFGFSGLVGSLFL